MFQKIQQLIDDKEALVFVLIDEVKIGLREINLIVGICPIDALTIYLLTMMLKSFVLVSAFYGTNTYL